MQTKNFLPLELQIFAHRWGGVGGGRQVFEAPAPQDPPLTDGCVNNIYLRELQ